MLKLGEKQKLQVVKKVDFGIYLAEREDNAAVVNGADFRLDAGNER